MLTEVKNQFKISFLSIKYALMREMLNKTTFISNIAFMILNNATFIIEWLVLYSIKDNVGGYTFNEILLLWGISASTYGFSHFFFYNSFSLSDIINSGILDAFLVQPKNVLLSAITTSVKTSALGDMLYGLIILFIYGFSVSRFLLFSFFTITGGIIITSIAVILGSLSFWFNKSDIIADTGNELMVNFSTYPDGIFKGFVKILLFTLVPVGIAAYIPVKVMISFNLILFIIVLGATILLVILAFLIFNRGLKKYTSSNLMIARI